MTNGRCQTCGQPLLPAEPLYDLQLAAALLPCSAGALRTHLYRHRAEYPARYRRQGSGHRRVRLLFGREIEQVRRQLLRGLL
jgi:hypothetical protein